MSSKKGGFSPVQRWTLFSTTLASSLVFIDSTALNVALPALQEDLGVTGTQLLWVINAYALFLSALLLVGGSLGDIFGRNKVFLIGLSIFSVTSLFCGIAQTPVQLILARGVQGIGGALLTPGSLSILSSQFGPENRGRAIGIWSTFSALTAVSGPVLGGWLAGIGLWRVIFFLNIPLSVAVFISLIRKVPESKNPDAKRLDFWGALLVTIGLMGISYGFIEAPKNGFGNIYVTMAFIVGSLAMLGFIGVQRFSSHPMMPLNLFRSSTFTGGNLLTLFVYAAMGGALFFLPLNLVQIQNYSELMAGMAMIPIIVIIASVSPLMGKYVDRKGPRLPLIIGPLITCAGYIFFSTAGITNGPEFYWNKFFPAFVLIGLGMGITVAPLTTAVMNALSASNAGIASGVNNTIARGAGVLAVAVMGAIALISFNHSMYLEINLLDLPVNTKNEIMSETSRFAGAKLPDSLSGETYEVLSNSLKVSFVTAFNKVVYLAAFLSFLGSVMAMLLIRNKKLAL